MSGDAGEGCGSALNLMTPRARKVPFASVRDRSRIAGMTNKLQISREANLLAKFIVDVATSEAEVE